MTPVLTNECWLGYHDNCELDEDCDCICHEVFDWDDAFEDGPTIDAIWAETDEALRKEGWVE